MNDDEFIPIEELQEDMEDDAEAEIDIPIEIMPQTPPNTIPLEGLDYDYGLSHRAWLQFKQDVDQQVFDHQEIVRTPPKK